MGKRRERTEILGSALLEFGVQLSASDSGIQALNDWFFENVQPDETARGMMAPTWYSISRDVAFFLGDEMISRWPSFHWQLFSAGKSNVAYNRPVIMGLRSPNPKMYIDIERMTISYGHRLVSVANPPSYETVNVRGVEVDVEEIARRHSERPARDEFLNWMGVAREFAP